MHIYNSTDGLVDLFCDIPHKTQFSTEILLHKQFIVDNIRVAQYRNAMEGTIDIELQTDDLGARLEFDQGGFNHDWGKVRLSHRGGAYIDFRRVSKWVFQTVLQGRLAYIRVLAEKLRYDRSRISVFIANGKYNMKQGGERKGKEGHSKKRLFKTKNKLL